jgi:hypothetical protein|tara:strand:- start:38 stop:262 length:225 start_codon:yes stop_codon:yes gene_type:complete
LHGYDYQEQQELEQMLESSSSLPRVERIFKHQVKVNTNEQLNRQVYQGETINLTCEKNDHHFKILVDNVVVDVL